MRGLLCTYKAVVAVRYPELVLHDASPIQIGHFVPHDLTVEYGGFRTVLWEAPKDLRTAVEDIVAFLQRRHRTLHHGATAQLLVMCNRTAVHNQLVQHGFRTTWEGGLRITTSSSAAGATARIAIIVQTGCGFLSGSWRDASDEEREDCYGRATVALTRAIQHTYVVSPVDMGGLIGVAQTLAVYHYGYLTLKNRTVQEHERASPPTDAAAVFEWGLDAPFASLDKPPLAIAMVISLNGERTVRRYRLVVAQKTRLRLNAQVAAALTSHASAHHLTTSGFFPCSIDREYLFGYAADGYRSPLWLCVAYEGRPVLVHRQRATTVSFHRAVQDRRVLVLPGIHFFDAHRLQPQLLSALEARDGLWTKLQNGLEGVNDTVQDTFSDEESTTTDPSTSDPSDDPTELEIASAADNLETMMNSSQPKSNIFFQPSSLGALPHLWLQAKLTISLSPILDSLARVFMTIAAELWVRGQIGTVNAVFASVARHFTVRLAEVLAKYLSTLMRKADSLATPETECLLYATYRFRPILSELIGAAAETWEVNRSRAPSGPVKAVVSQQPHVRHHAGIEVHAGISALFAWFPASWASKVAPVFVGSEGSKISPQVINIPCPNRAWDGAQNTAEALALQAVRFIDKNVVGLALGIEDEFLNANSFFGTIAGLHFRRHRTVHDARTSSGECHSCLTGCHCPITQRAYAWEVEANSYSMSLRLALQL